MRLHGGLHLDNSLTVANAGDCRAVLGCLSSNGGLNVIATPRQIMNHSGKKNTSFNSINVMNGPGGEFQESYLASSKIVAKPLTSVHNACEEAEKRKLAKVSFTINSLPSCYTTNMICKLIPGPSK